MFRYIVKCYDSYLGEYTRNDLYTENQRESIKRLIALGTNVTTHLEPGYIEEVGSDHDCLVEFLKHYRDGKSVKDLFVYKDKWQVRNLILHWSNQCLDSTTIEEVYGLSLEEMKRILLDGYYCVVTRSYKPSEKLPWKQVARRTYLWCVPAYDADKDAGRRIEWGGDTTMFASRKEALNFMYKVK